jgi:hypothetical protein
MDQGGAGRGDGETWSRQTLTASTFLQARAGETVFPLWLELDAGAWAESGGLDWASGVESHGRACHSDARSYTLYGETLVKYYEGRLNDRLVHG